jgi:nucleoside-diphosphate-sugar epimerase
MRVFVTGSTGFIGSAIVPELIKAGHQVLGLTRSDAGAQSLIAAGAEVHRGDLEDLESLRSGAAASDAVIHTAFIHDWSRFKEVCEIDRRAIETLGDALAGTNRPLIVTSGIGALAPGRVASEATGLAQVSRGVNVSVVRLPQVHDTVKQGLITYAVQLAREKGVSAYVGDGSNRWSAAHVNDVAHLYRLALEKHEAGSRYHAVSEEGVSMREIAEVIGKGLKVPVVSLSQEEAQAHFGWQAIFAGLDMPASSAQTRKKLGWNPTGATLLTDLENMRYSKS